MNPVHRSNRADPFWDLDGVSAQRSRRRRQITRALTAVLLVALAIGVGATLATRIGDIDPTFIRDAGRPILATAILSLLGAAVLIGLSRMRRPVSR